MSKDTIDVAEVEHVNQKELIKVHGVYEPNISSGLTLPVVCVIKGNVVINMQHVSSHIRVECSEETPEMTKWIEEGKLLKVEGGV